MSEPHTCSGCGASVFVFYMCDRDTRDETYCTECFAGHPCGKGKHEEDCATLVMDDQKKGTDDAPIPS